MPRGLVYVHEGFVWFIEGATCLMASLRAPPKGAVRVAGFGSGVNPTVDAALEPLRQAVLDPGPEAAPPQLHHEVEGKMERRSIARTKGSTNRAQAVFFSVVHVLQRCGAEPPAIPPAPPPPAAAPQSDLPDMFL